ncbi:MAG: L-asparaginase [Erythrobacter sp. RIFCSPHIGHO2_12_FULL_63_10]|nr:MAG: L-asparaginase [Erythrobacter sp. RIFCSPHIGHO2_12_FULL_63_10]
MTTAHIRVLATGGTIAGSGGSAIGRGYVPGRIGIAEMVAEVHALGLDAELDSVEIAAIGSQDIGWDEWNRLHAEVLRAQADASIDGIIITHGTDTAEETAYLLNLTLDAGKPVVLVGAMRPADAVGSDGMRNFANAVRVASDPQAHGRGVMVVMGDAVFAARDVRKAATSNIDAFKGFPRGALARVTPASLDWFVPAARAGELARFAWPDALPRVAVLYVGAGMDEKPVQALAGIGCRGIVLAGMGQGNAPATVLDELEEARRAGVVIVRSSRVDEGIVDRNLEVDDDARGFVAAHALGPSKARILLQLLIADGTRDPADVQAAFDRA